MSTFTVVFDKRDDTEAAEILQFLESHLGYKKFRFVMPRPYGTDADPLTTQSRPHNSTFYCPSWNHEIVYKNNHTISATFIESSTAVQEDLANPKGPCFGAYIYNPITQHEMCTYSPVITAHPQKGLDKDNAIEIKRKKIDMVIVVQHTPSMIKNSGYGNKRIIDVVSDVIKKMFMSYDDYICPGTESYGIFNTPSLAHNSDQGNDNVPPFPFNDVANTIESYLEGLSFEDTFAKADFNIQDHLTTYGYDIVNLNKFTIKLDYVNLNLGVILGTNKTPIRAADLSYLPNGFDKVSYLIGPKEDGYRKGGVYGGDILETTSVYEGTNAQELLAGGMAQLYNSARCENVDQRVVLFVGDGNFSNTSGWNKIISGIKGDGILSKRRPLNSELHDYGVDLQMGTYSANPGARQYNPDLDIFDANPSWYNDTVPTIVSCLPVGGTPQPFLKENVTDYEQNNNDPQFYGIGTKRVGIEKEIDKIFNIFRIADSVSYDTGFENLFSITVHNCGPGSVKLKNTIVNSDQQSTTPKHYIEKIRPGITKSNDYFDIKYLQNDQSIIDMKPGRGGQFYSDPSNQKLFTEDKSDLIWHNFNTKKEVFRNGEIEEINGGWGPELASYEISTDDQFILATDSGEILMTDPVVVGEPETKGVLNEGVAFKNFPAKIFKMDSGLELIDYNISNLSKSKACEGDYDNLPILNKDESIDLFFGLRAGADLNKYSENLQMVFNAEPIGIEKDISCYGNVDILVKSDPNEVKYQNQIYDGVVFDADYIVFTYEFLDGRDMDTRTSIVTPNIGGPLGWCKGRSVGNILTWGGDNLGTGVEGTLLDINAFKSQYPSEERIEIKFEAWWYAVKGVKPLNIKAGLYRGGTPRNDHFGFVLDGYSELLWVQSRDRIVTRNQSRCVGDPDYMINFAFHVPTLTCQFLDRS